MGAIARALQEEPLIGGTVIGDWHGSKDCLQFAVELKNINVHTPGNAALGLSAERMPAGGSQVLEPMSGKNSSDRCKPEPPKKAALHEANLQTEAYLSRSWRLWSREHFR